MLSKYVSKKEAYDSPTAQRHRIVNIPSPEQEKAIIFVSVTYFDKFRESVKNPLYISSLYRSHELNLLVGGASNSDHLVKKDSKGAYYVAYDIDQDEKGKISNREVFNAARKDGRFYKIIWEFGGYPVFPTPFIIDESTGIPIDEQVRNSKLAIKGNPSWVHISWSTDPAKNTGKYVYQAIKRGGKTIYITI